MPRRPTKIILNPDNNPTVINTPDNDPQVVPIVEQSESDITVLNRVAPAVRPIVNTQSKTVVLSNQMPGAQGPTGADGATIRHGLGAPATGIPPLDGVHDPWRPIDAYGDWLGQPYAVSWEAGAVFTSPADPPAGGQYFWWTVAFVEPWNVWWRQTTADLTIDGTGVIALGYATQDLSAPSDLTYDAPAAIVNCTGFTLIEPYEFDSYQSLPGNEGDYYIDESNVHQPMLYGPLTAGEWGNPIALKGDPGDQGETGQTGDTGVQGDPGTPGIDNTPDSYHHVQGTPTDTWIIAHGLPFNPNWQVRDSAGSSAYGDVVHTPGLSTITFSASFSGEADGS